MTTRVVPSDLNWVELEGEWDLSTAFKKLQDVANRDADASEKLLAKRQETLHRWHSHFVVHGAKSVGLDSFDITACLLADDTHVRARIVQSRKEGKIYIEMHTLGQMGGTGAPAPSGGFTLKPRISDHGEQMFSVVDGDADLLYPWQVIRKAVDNLRELLLTGRGQ